MVLSTCDVKLACKEGIQLVMLWLITVCSYTASSLQYFKTYPNEDKIYLDYGLWILSSFWGPVGFVLFGEPLTITLIKQGTFTSMHNQLPVPDFHKYLLSAGWLTPPLTTNDPPSSALFSQKPVLDPPFIQTYQRVCTYNETRMVTVKLPNCSAQVDPFYTYPVALRCDCGMCATSTTECIMSV